jgi:hypothetical protein
MKPTPLPRPAPRPTTQLALPLAARLNRLDPRDRAAAVAALARLLLDAVPRLRRDEDRADAR